MPFLETMIGKLLMTFGVAMVPVLELRGAIPMGIAAGLHPAVACAAAIAGNLAPAPLIILLGCGLAAAHAVFRAENRLAGAPGPSERPSGAEISTAGPCCPGRYPTARNGSLDGRAGGFGAEYPYRPCDACNFRGASGGSGHHYGSDNGGHPSVVKEFV